MTEQQFTILQNASDAAFELFNDESLYRDDALAEHGLDDLAASFTDTFEEFFDELLSGEKTFEQIIDTIRDDDAHACRFLK